MKKIVMNVIGIVSIGFSSNIATGFDYPIGNKGYDSNGNKVPIDEHIKDWGNGYNVDRNEEYNLREGVYSNNSRYGKSVNSSIWYNISDVGNFLNLKYTYGLHPGEDWNKGYGKDDVGEPIYSVANGVIKYIKTAYTNNSQFGWTVIVEHNLPNNSKIYSLYTHITYDKNNKNGTIASTQNQFTFQVGQMISKGEIIGRVASITGMSPHFHFEIRDKISKDIYPNDNGNGYYTHNKTKVSSMTKNQVIQAFDLMRKDGILDASDFIDDHRTINGESGGNNNLPIVDGAGSLIRTELLGTGTADEKRCQWGCYRDEADMQSHSKPSTVSFQWKATNSCKKLKIGILASKEYREKYNTWINPHNPLKVKIYTKAWDSSVVSKAFETTLPKTVEYVDGWNNIIITSKEPLDKKTEIIAECTKSDDGKEVMMLDEETSVDLPLDYKFGGQSSIIRDSNKNYNEQEDGIYQDVAIGLSDNKAMSLFQWQTSSNCSSLILKSGHYPNNNGISATVNGVSIKGWADKNWKDNKCNKKLPCTLKNPSTDGKSHFYIIKIKTNSNALDGNRISAVCTQ